MFIGIGYDVHSFAKNRPLFICGVKIDYEYGLMGHSDADAAIHALMDALLGAAGLEDIGHFFPNTDNQYKNISSMELLKKVVLTLKNNNFIINNVDISIIAEKPKIFPYIIQMKKNISEILNIPVTRTGVKATTNEKMGFIGRGEGIAVMAVASIKNTGI